MAEVPDDKGRSEPSQEPIRLLEAREIGRRGPKNTSWLFQNVSLEIRPGQRLAIVGPTGAGKTLLLRALAFLDPVDAGVILWRGQPVGGGMVPLFRRQVIYLHQRPVLFGGTVEDNLRQPFAFKALHGFRFDRERVVQLLAEVSRSEEFLARSHKNLSGGERQIVALLRAIELDPEILLLDEPTAALDADSTEVVEALITRWQSERSTERSIVWVSHNAQQVQRIADRVLSIQNGQIREEHRP